MEKKREIVQFFNRHQEEILGDIGTLIKIPSVVSEEEPGMPYGKEAFRALKEAEKIAERLGFHTKTSENACMTADYGDRENRLCLLAHLDVVPAGEGWTRPPYELSEEGGKLFGRGIADDKGPAVMLLYAMKAAKEICPDLSYSPQVWLGTAEEVGSPDLKNYQNHTKLPPFSLTPDALETIVIGECAKHRPEFYRVWEKNEALPRVCSLEGGTVRNAIPGYARAKVAGLGAETIRPYAQQITAQTGVEFILENIGDQKMQQEIGGAEICAVGQGAHIGKPEKGRNAQTALIELLALLPLADCPQTRAIHSLHVLFPYGDLAGRGLGLTVRDEIMGETKTNFTVCRMTETEIRCKLDSRGPLTANRENYSDVIDRALREKGFVVVSDSMDEAHYVPEGNPLVQMIRKIVEQYCEYPAPCSVSIGASYAHYIDGAVATGVASPGVDTRLHKSDEFMYSSDLMRIGMIYTQAILEICR